MSNVIEFPKPKEPILDAKTIEQLEQALAIARAGQITGLVLYGWDATTNGFIRWVSLPEREADKSAAAFRFLGGIELVADDLKFIATESYPKLGEMSAAPVEPESA